MSFLKHWPPDVPQKKKKRKNDPTPPPVHLNLPHTCGGLYGNTDTVGLTALLAPEPNQSLELKRLLGWAAVPVAEGSAISPVRVIGGRANKGAAADH